ncbi:hypothetical protein B0H14DRAFT_2570624 [Mycena olivaceomarginata]|nr:hypothetical protein B0H14DRAFT_2570624 [Mycena olivaceomarginata]
MCLLASLAATMSHCLQHRFRRDKTHVVPSIEQEFQFAGHSEWEQCKDVHYLTVGGREQYQAGFPIERESPKREADIRPDFVKEQLMFANEHGAFPENNVSCMEFLTGSKDGTTLLGELEAGLVYCTMEDCVLPQCCHGAPQFLALRSQIDKYQRGSPQFSSSKYLTTARAHSRSSAVSCPRVLELQLEVPSNDQAWLRTEWGIKADFPELRRIKSQWVAIAKNVWNNCARPLSTASTTSQCTSAAALPIVELLVMAPAPDPSAPDEEEEDDKGGKREKHAKATGGRNVLTMHPGIQGFDIPSSCAAFSDSSLEGTSADPLNGGGYSAGVCQVLKIRDGLHGAKPPPAVYRKHGAAVGAFRNLVDEEPRIQLLRHFSGIAQYLTSTRQAQHLLSVCHPFKLV